MQWRIRLIPTTVIFTMSLFSLTVSAQMTSGNEKNFLPNPSFEETENSRPKFWAATRWAGEGSHEYAPIGRTGGHSVSITSEKGADIAWTCNVPVEPMSRYRLSGWIKTENVRTQGQAHGALFNIHNIQPVATKAVAGTSDWTEVSIEFDTGMEDSLIVNCLFGGWGFATGRAWYDDVKLELLQKGEIPAPRITIDASKTGEPINPYIYGQFIEHLGHCIYGGIWAEMLEDRKFFDPVGAPPVAQPPSDGSPWKAVNGVKVEMSSDAPFVGRHSPVIKSDKPGQGIEQGNLGLLAGAEYVGRIWLSGDPSAAPITITLAWGDKPDQCATHTIARIGPDYSRTDFRFKSGAATEQGRLRIASGGNGAFRIGTVSLMPASNINGLRADTLALLKELKAPVYRWPGGNFVSGYNWKDGLGDPDRRPPRKNPAWRGIEHNDFGLHEFIALCRLLETEPYIAVNAGLGGVDSAREEVEYCNGPADSPQGRQRAANGAAEPFRVRFWGIGNEMYGDWQLGHMALEQYVKKHNEFAAAMRKVDPSLVLIGVGELGKWDEMMLTHCADAMAHISEHIYCQERPGLAAHVWQIPEAIRRKAKQHREYRQQLSSLQGKDIRIVMDEWNYWYGPDIFGEIGTRYFLKDALGIAAGLHEFYRNSDLFFMANYAQTVNVIGCIKTNKTAAAFETTGLVLKLYRERFGTTPVQTQTTPFLDALAAWSADRRTLTVGVVNPTRQALKIPLEIRGAALSGKGQAWQIAGPDPQAYNDPGQPPRVTIENVKIDGLPDTLAVAPCSVTLFALEAK